MAKTIQNVLIYGYGVARQTPVVLFTPPTAMRHVALLLMLPFFPLLFAAYLPGRIKTAARHPMLLAVKLWAVAHLLANGTLHDLLLFGAFLAWAVADRIAVKRRAVPHPPERGGSGARVNRAYDLAQSEPSRTRRLLATTLWEKRRRSRTRG